MKTTALRLYGKKDLRLESFELPALKDTEILADITSNSICMSSYKAAVQGADHKRVPLDTAENPVIVGHEFCGSILEVGARVKTELKKGGKYSIQPAFHIPGRELEAPGYSFQYIGGHATKIIIPSEAMEMGCLLPYSGEGFFKASLSEPVSTIIGAFNTSYHYTQGEYIYRNGIVEGGTCAILAGAGPMGLGAIDYAVHGPRKPGLLVVTDIDQTRLDRAADIYTPDEAKSRGVRLKYINTGKGNPVQQLLALTGGKGFDDVFVFTPASALAEQADRILGFNGCLNFFAGPSDKHLSAPVNFYEVHYSGHHIVGSSGGNTDDMKAALELMSAGAINPAVMITHVGGLNAAADTILHLPEIPGGKKLIYTQVSMPLTAIDSFEELGGKDPFYRKLAELTDEAGGLWSVTAEEYLLQNAPPISP
jgi:threonine dehydrogenase-like Zn-dependent dehydrogenase